MGYRDSVVINVSYFCPSLAVYDWSELMCDGVDGFSKLPQGPNKDYSKDNPAFVAAGLALSSINFRDAIIKGTVTPDEAGGVKLDMDHYKWMLNACRIPAKPLDYARKIREDDPAGDHFIVIRHNHFYKVPIHGVSFALSRPRLCLLALVRRPTESGSVWQASRRPFKASMTRKAIQQSLLVP
jgi:carnitine O-acetyltransferase